MISGEFVRTGSPSIEAKLILLQSGKINEEPGGYTIVGTDYAVNVFLIINHVKRNDALIYNFMKNWVILH